MGFQVGDSVVHCSYGLGQVLAIEERVYNEKTALYYMVQVADLTIWVHDDENLNNRLRFPTSKSVFKKSLALLSAPPDPLPDDRHQRNLLLLKMVKEGGIESLCRAIRDLTAYRQARSWSEYDSAVMKRAQKALIGEWSYILSVSPPEAEMELHRLLSHQTD